MPENSSRKQVEEILQDGINAGIFLEQPRLSDRKKRKIEKLKNHDLTLIYAIEKLKNNFKQSLGNFSEREVIFLLFWNYINILTFNIEILKIFFYYILDKHKVTFPKANPEYGRTLSEICQKLGYSKQKKNIIKDRLYADFRNAIAHQDFEITMDKVIVTFADGKKINYDVKKLNDAIQDVKSIHNTIEEYFKNLELILDKKTYQVNEQQKIKLKKLDVVKQKLKEQRKFRTEQKEKLLHVKNEMSRVNRKSAKLGKQKNILHRKKKRKSKQTAKIVKS